jgi:hypothetical protein
MRQQGASALMSWFGTPQSQLIEQLRTLQEKPHPKFQALAHGPGRARELLLLRSFLAPHQVEA